MFLRLKTKASFFAINLTLKLGTSIIYYITYHFFFRFCMNEALCQAFYVHIHAIIESNEIAILPLRKQKSR